jgi:hypothetical protein
MNAGFALYQTYIIKSISESQETGEGVEPRLKWRCRPHHLFFIEKSYFIRSFLQLSVKGKDYLCLRLKSAAKIVDRQNAFYTKQQHKSAGDAACLRA